MNKKTVLLLALLVAVIAAGTYALYGTGLIDLFVDRERLLEFIDRHRNYTVFIFIGLQAMQVIAAPIPGEMTGFVGGLLFGPWWGVVFSTVGLTLGSWAAFLLARLMGRPLVETLVRAETVKRFDYVMKHKGLFLAFLMFLIPGFPKDYLCYLLGLGHMRQRDFLAISVSGRLLGTVLLTLGGSYFRDERWGALFVVIGIGLGVVLLTMVYRRRIERWIRRLRAVQRLKSMVARRHARAVSHHANHPASNSGRGRPVR